MLGSLVLVPLAVDAQEDGPIVVTAGKISSVDDVVAILVSDALGVGDGQDLDQLAESPFGSGETPMPGPTQMWVSAAYFSGIDLQQLQAATIGEDFPDYFYYTPIDFSYYGTDQAFVGYQVIVDAGEDWRETYPYLEAGVGLSKPGLDGAVSPEDLENDPFVGSERTNTYVWGGGVERAVTGFARQEPGLDLFQSAYVTAVTPLTDGVFAVTTLIPDPTYDFRHVVSWGDGVDPNSVGFIKVDGEALGTQDPIPADLGAETAAGITADFAEFVAALGAGGAVSDGTPSGEQAPPTDDGGEDDGATVTPIQEEASEGAPIVLIVGGFVVLVLVIGGVTFYVWGNRGRGKTETFPTVGEDRTGGEMANLKDGPIPLETAVLFSELKYRGLPPEAPVSEFGSLLNRAEAIGLPKTYDGWQLLEFDMAYDYLLSKEREVDPTGPGQVTRLVTLWDVVAPPNTPIDGNKVGIWYDPIEGIRVGTPTDPHAFVTPPEHLDTPVEEKPPPEPAPPPEPEPEPDDGAATSDSIDMDGDGPGVVPA